MKRTLSILSTGIAAIAAVTLITLSAVPELTIAASVERAPVAGCQNLPSEAQLRQLLVQAASVNKPIGGLFQGARMWAAVVNRDGAVCAYNTSTGDPTQVWPGSQAIAKAKAY